MRVFRCDGYYQEAVHLHGLLCFGGIMSKRLKLYNVNIKYIRNLHNVDDNVPSVSPQIGKYARPFLGIIVLVPWESVLVLLWRRLNSMLLLMGKN